MSTKITVNNNGSLKIEGDFTIVDREGNVYDLGGRTVLGLCRCGLSKNKPFCDGAHNAVPRCASCSAADARRSGPHTLHTPACISPAHPGRLHDVGGRDGMVVFPSLIRGGH